MFFINYIKGLTVYVKKKKNQQNCTFPVSWQAGQCYCNN